MILDSCHGSHSQREPFERDNAHRHGRWSGVHFSCAGVLVPGLLSSSTITTYSFLTAVIACSNDSLHSLDVRFWARCVGHHSQLVVSVLFLVCRRLSTMRSSANVRFFLETSSSCGKGHGSVGTLVGADSSCLTRSMSPIQICGVV